MRFDAEWFLSGETANEAAGATPISVAELARVLEGTSDVRLFEPLDTGVWLAIDGDRVRSIGQQYQP